MFDRSKEISNYHDEKVRLPENERKTMRERRDTNRTRVKDGLKNDEKPAPRDFATQGSYAMKTMTQDPNSDYDIDDGVYFYIEDLVGPDDSEMSPLEARKMVRDAVDNGSFKTAPEVRKNCVRVYYEAGYHVDIPVYRRVPKTEENANIEYYFELASSGWIRSDARNVTGWFNDENAKQSPGDAPDQFRRICRLLKMYATSRENWKGKIASGFMITKLLSECYKPNAGREDTALYDTMSAIKDRLSSNLVVEHPVTPDSTITNGDNDPKARFLMEKLEYALEKLEVLFNADCTEEQAAKAWDDVFNTTYFSDKIKPKENAAKASNSGGGILSGMTGGFGSPDSPVKKGGGGTYG